MKWGVRQSESRPREGSDSYNTAPYEYVIKELRYDIFYEMKPEEKIRLLSVSLSPIAIETLQQQ